MWKICSWDIDSNRNVKTTTVKTLITTQDPKLKEKLIRQMIKMRGKHINTLNQIRKLKLSSQFEAIHKIKA